MLKKERLGVKSGFRSTNHAPFHTRPKCRNFGQWAKADDATLPQVFKWEWTWFDFGKIVKRSGMDVRSWNFFISRCNPCLQVKKFQLCTCALSCFYNIVKEHKIFHFLHCIFQKLCSFPFKYMVEHCVVSLHSSTEVSTFWPCVKWTVVQTLDPCQRVTISRDCTINLLNMKS